MKTASPVASRVGLRTQSGVALIVALIMLVIATLVGLAGIRAATLQEKLSANLFDRAIGMQAAEYALRDAETWLFETDRSTILATSSITDCSATEDCPGVPANAFSGNSAEWQSITLPSTFNADFSAPTSPQYHILYLGLKNSEANTDVTQLAGALQYGATGGGSAAVNVIQNAVYLVTARSHQPSNDNDRSIVVLSTLVKSN